jgi:choline dehydrogenase-like flavoprotein
MILEAFKETWKRHTDGPSYGPKLKHTIESNGDWHIFMQGFGEMLPRYKNHISLDFADLDACGMPKVVFDCAYSDNEKAMQDSMQKEAAEMLMRAGCTDIVKYNDHAPPGRCIHEMGTARMGLDPATSFLNGNNQSHAVSNLFVTDGSCMPSSASQNPSLTYMALTARASFFIKKYLTEAA